MRCDLRTGLRSAASGLALLAAAGVATAQTPQGVPTLAIEREPPTATRPVAPAPVLVPQPSGPPMVTQAPTAPAPIVVPPGPAPVAVPEPAKPGPVFVPETPKIQGSSTPAAAPTAPAAPAATPSEPAPAPAAAPAPTSEAAPVKPSEPTPPAASPAPAPTPVAPSGTPVVPLAEPPAGSSAAPAPSTGAPVSPVPPVGTPVVPLAEPPGLGSPAPTAPEAAKPVEAAPQPTTEEVDVEARPVLFVTGVTTWDQAEEKLGGVFASLAQAAKKLGIAEHGAPLVEYIESDSDDVGFRAMLPVPNLPKGKLPKGIKAGRSPSGKALKFRHNGPLDDLEEVYGRIDDELAKRGVEAKTILEQYDEDALASPEDRVVVDVYVFLK